MLDNFLQSVLNPQATQHFPIKFLGQLQGRDATERGCPERAVALDAAFTLDHAAWVKEDGEWWSQVVFWWEWEHVRDVAGSPLRGR